MRSSESGQYYKTKKEEMSTIPININAIVFTLNSGLSCGGGFFSVFFFLCNAYLHAKNLCIPFFIQHDEWPYTFQKGWHDYFTTLEQLPPFFSTSEKNVQHSSHMKAYHPVFSLKEYADCIQTIFKLRPELYDRVSILKEQLGTSYIAIFVRRGDKLIEEASYIHFKDILSKITYDENSVFFIQTDDFTVVEEAKVCLPLNTIMSTVPHTKRGSFHSRYYLEKDKLNACNSTIIPWTEKTKQDIYDETTEMLVGLHVCIAASECWTDITSNVGRFLVLSNPSAKVYPCEITVDLQKLDQPWYRIT